MNVFAVSLPMPPTSNTMFTAIVIKGKQRRIISRGYKAWRADATSLISEAWDRAGRPCFDRHMALMIHIGLNYTGDISNRIKAIEDALGEAIPGHPDDRYYDRVEIERVPGLDGARILITQLAPPDTRCCEAVPFGELAADIARRAAAGMQKDAA